MADNNRDIRRDSTSRKAVPAKGTPSAQNKDYEGTPLSMTGIRNSLMHSAFTKIVLGLLIVIFAVSFLFTSRLPTAGSLGQGGGTASAGPDPAATIGSMNISRDLLNRMFANQVENAGYFGRKPGPPELLGLKQQALTTLSQQDAEAQAATAAGIVVSDADVDKEIETKVDASIKQEKGADEATFRRQVEAKYPNGEADYQAELRKNYDRDAVRQEVLLRKYEESVKGAVKSTEDEYKQSVTRLQLRQIVVHPKLPGPTEKDFQAAQAANAAAALSSTKTLAKGLDGVSGPALVAAFDALAKTHSDNAVTKSKGGVLGSKLPSELPMGQNIKDALQSAKTQLVGPLQDDITKDVYLFLIENRQLQLPRDYAKKKATYLKDFNTAQAQTVWSKKQEVLNKSATPEVFDPSLVAYKLQTQDIPAASATRQPELRKQALDKYQEALGYAVPLEQAAIRYQMAQLYSQAGQPAKAVEVLQAAVKGSGDVPSMRMELAQSLMAVKRNREAVEQLKAAAKDLDNSPSSPSPFGGGNPDDQTRTQLSMAFAQLGDQADAAAQRKKVAPPSANPMSGLGGLGGLRGLKPGTIHIPAK